ncbi:hypothetical protein [Luteimonas sp. TWI1437]|uniref:hypothetical protein n=1 Tax=unclassified Luteimonas TaxID=2629088 RepID=UPI003207BE15
MRAIPLCAAACLLAACASTPTAAPVSAPLADAARCDALAGDGWRRIPAPKVAAELLALAYVATPPTQARWYVANDGRHAACLPPDAGTSCGHVLHTFQPQIHRMWSWSGSAARSEACPGG